jgi:predicted MPP superfamily phosphohydrolase
LTRSVAFLFLSTEFGTLRVIEPRFQPARNFHNRSFSLTILKRRQLPAARSLTGKERRLMNPNRGLVKLGERYLDMFFSRFVYPWFGHIWSPYCWVLERRFCLAETKLAPAGWPHGLPPLRVLLVSDIHGGIFLKPETLSQIVHALMQEKPDLVVVAGDLVTGHTNEATRYLDVLAPLAQAPLGAWFCFGNHDYFGGSPDELRANLEAIGIKTLKNESVSLTHRGRGFVLGGIDDRIMGQPNWDGVLAAHGVPHLLISHNPDHFYDAEARGIALTLSGHTHGGQIRFPGGPAIIRQSRYCLDEGVYAFRSSLLVVSRGLGSVMLPFRWGADPEAVLIEIVPRN